MKLMECDHCLKMVEISSNTATKAWCEKCATEHRHLLSELGIDLPSRGANGAWSRPENVKKLELIPKYDNIVS